MRGRARKVRSRESLVFGFGELGRRVALAGEQRGDRLDVEAVRLSERAQHFGARLGPPMIQADELFRRSAS